MTESKNNPVESSPQKEGLKETYPFDKLSRLARIKDFVQEVVVAIAAVTKVDVTIVDENLVRIAGSGKYVNDLDTVLTQHTISDQVLKTGRIFILENPRINGHCAECTLKNKCKELAEISYPFKLHNETIGNIALIAFNLEQRELLLAKKEEYMEFIKKTSALLAHEIELLEKSKQVTMLSKQLEMLIDKMDQGILFVDPDGKILLFNDLAREYLGGHFHSGTLVTESIPEFHWPDEEAWDQLITRNNETYSISIKTIQQVGALVEIHKISFIQKREQEIRRKISSKPPIAGGTFADMVGNHPKFLESVNLARKFSQVDATVLISAETGTGKELFAQSIHNNSSRRGGPFVAINCAAIPETLLESELFGYASGAFTGAKKGGKMGLFEQAHQGTVFLDEIAEMPLSLQSRLLRVLQDKEVRRIGDDKLIPVDVRIIAATNKKIRHLMDVEQFREDVFYRLNVLRLRIPPLRDRIEDIPLLIQHFAIQSCKNYHRPPVAFSKESLALMVGYRWPGNIRELYNVVQRSVLLTDLSLVDVSLINSILTDYTELEAQDSYRFDLVLDGSFKNLVKQIIEKMMERSGDEDSVSDLLGISKTTIWRRLNAK